MNHGYVSETIIKTLRGAEEFVPHQSRSHASRELTHKLKQLCKICIVDPKPQKVTTHATGNITQIPKSKKISCI